MQLYERKEYPGLDVLKFILAIIVVLRHIGQAFLFNTTWYYLIFTNLISPVAIPTYFMISGFLLFSKSVDTSTFFRQVKRIAKLYLIWTIVYLPYNLFFINQSENPLNSLLLFVRDSLFSGSFYHLWFLPSLIVSFAVVYLLIKKGNWKTAFCICLLLFFIGVFGETYFSFLPEGIQRLIVSYTKVFVTTRNGLFFGSIFVLIGAYLARNPACFIFAKKRLLLSVGWIGTLAEVLLLVHYRGSSIIVNMTISSLCLSIGVFCLFWNRCKGICISRAKELRKASTIIFCAHPAILILVGYLGFDVFTSTALALVILLPCSLIFVFSSKKCKFLDIFC